MMVLQKMVMTPRISHEIHRERIGNLHLRDLSLVLAAPGRVAHYSDYTPPVAIDQSLFPLASREAKLKNVTSRPPVQNRFKKTLVVCSLFLLKR